MNKTTPSHEALQQLPYIKIKDCPAVTGLSQGFVRELIRTGVLPVLRHGRCIYVNKQLLLDTLDNNLRQQMDQNTDREDER